MPDYTKPNLKIPVSLWGEVKVSAFRRGVKPVDIVVECLSERFAVTSSVGNAVPGSTRMNSEVTGKSERNRQMEESPPEKVNPSISAYVSKPSPVDRKQPVVKSQSIGGVPVGPLVARLPVGESEVVKMKCSGCGESMTKWTVAKSGKPYCQDCVDNQRNGQ